MFLFLDIPLLQVVCIIGDLVSRKAWVSKLLWKLIVWKNIFICGVTVIQTELLPIGACNKIRKLKENEVDWNEWRWSSYPRWMWGSTYIRTYMIYGCGLPFSLNNGELQISNAATPLQADHFITKTQSLSPHGWGPHYSILHPLTALLLLLFYFVGPGLM